MAGNDEEKLNVEPLSVKIKHFELYDLLKDSFKDELLNLIPNAEMIRLVFYIPGTDSEPGQYFYLGHESRKEFKEKVIEVEAEDPSILHKVIKVIETENRR